MRYLIILTGVLFVFTGRLMGQDDYVPTSEDSVAVFQGLFNHDEPLELTLRFDLKKFKRDRRKENYMDAEMTSQVNENIEVIHPVRIRARGIYRRDNCTYPPFWLNVRDAGMDIDSITDIDIKRIKMVVRCRPAAQYKHYILREYLTYKIYNMLSPYSFRVRLVKLNIMDTSKDDAEQEDWAFLIEPVDLLALRCNGVMVTSDVLSIRTVNREVMNMMAMYQYMIGNGDWSITGRHNFKVITLKPPGKPGYIPIPYDLDYCGLVDATYATPQESLGISTVTERFFLGACRPDEEQRVAIEFLEAHKDQIIEYIMGFEYLDIKEREDMVAYIESYYTEASDERFISRRITPTCR